VSRDVPGIAFLRRTAPGEVANAVDYLRWCGEPVTDAAIVRQVIRERELSRDASRAEVNANTQ